MLQRLRKPTAQLIAEMDDEPDLPPFDIIRTSPNNNNRSKEPGKDKAPSTSPTKQQHSSAESPTPSVSPSKIFSPTRTSGPPVFPQLPPPNLQTPRPISSVTQNMQRQSLASPGATTKTSDSPSSSLATSGASSPNTVIFKPAVTLAKQEPTEITNLDSEPKPRRFSGVNQAPSGVYRAVPIPEHEELQTNELANKETKPKVSDPSSPEVAEKPAVRPTKLKIPPPTLPKPKYVKTPAGQRSSSNVGHYDVPRIHTPRTNASAHVYASPSTEASRQAFNNARNSIASSPAFSQEVPNNTRHSITYSPDQNPMLSPQGRGNVRHSIAVGPGHGPVLGQQALIRGRNSISAMPVQSGSTSHLDYKNNRNSIAEGLRQSLVVGQPAAVDNTAYATPINLSQIPIKSRHSIAAAPAQSPSVPPWERSSGRVAPWDRHVTPSPTRTGKPRFVPATNDESTRRPATKTLSLQDYQPQNSNTPRMRTTISEDNPSHLNNYQIPGQPRKVATVKPNSSIKHSTYHSFMGHLQTQYGTTSQSQGHFKVKPPTVANIEGDKARHTHISNGVETTPKS